MATKKKRNFSLFSLDDFDDDSCVDIVREVQTTFDSNRSKKKVSLITLASSSKVNMGSVGHDSGPSQAKAAFLASEMGTDYDITSNDKYSFSSTVQEVKDVDPDAIVECDSDVEFVDDEDSDVEESESKDASKRLRYRSLDDFRELKGEFLQQLMRTYYPGKNLTTCTSCQSVGAPILCLDCFHFMIRCQKCTLDEHSHLPLHRLQYFDGRTWRRTTLCALGLIVYLGHGGAACPALRPTDETKRIIVLDINGIQEVNVFFCTCDQLVGIDAVQRSQLIRHGWFPATTENPRTVVTLYTLDTFEAMSGEGKMSGYHFYKSLLRLSNGFGYSTIPKRYEEFMRMTREYQHLKLIQRAGKIWNADGRLTMDDCELATECPACPLPGKNIPDDWDKRIDSWIYSLFVMIDANFRLKLKRKRSPNDVELGGGLSYFVRKDKYKEYLKKAVEEKEIKYCDSGLRAVDHANLKGGKGYEASGIVGVQCRHMLIRGNGIGDLQKGEKYANVDYVVLSSLKNLEVNRVVMSYDIMCQYSRNFVKRMSSFDKDMRLNLSKISLDFVIPQFHIYGHGDSCRTRYNLRYHEHVGRTDGENIERGWAFLNPLSMASKEMGPGSRSDYLDWHIGDWNYQRILSFGRLFTRKLVEAVEEGVKHANVVDDLRKSLPKGMVIEVEVNIKRWFSNPTKFPDPFAHQVHGVSVLKVRRELAEAEALEDAGGTLTSGNSSVTHWLVVGLELEDSQASIKKLYKKNKNGKVTATTVSASEKNAALVRKMRVWKKMQAVHMSQLTDHEIWDPVPDEKGYLHCWTVDLNLPSSISFVHRDALCSPALIDKEYRLRMAQARDALDEIRLLLQKQWWLSSKKRQHVSGPGQRNNTQSSCAIQALRERREVHVERYRRARVAMAAIKPGGSWQNSFKILRDEDIRPMEDDEGKGEGRRTLSWLWVAEGAAFSGNGNSSDEIYKGLKIEYAKALARSQRWLEEAQLLREEMRRVLCYINWRSRWWLEHISTLKGCEDEISLGYVVYGNRQALYLEQLGQKFRREWAVRCNIPDLPLIQEPDLIVIEKDVPTPRLESLSFE